MGNCWSTKVNSVVTGKLILSNDKLEEFVEPVKVSYVLERNPNCFVCNSDEMEFNKLVSAVDEEEELKPGQLYFTLPVSWLTRRLQPQDMACLAAKASAALERKRSKRFVCCKFGRVDSVVFFDNVKQLESGGLVVVGKDGRRSKFSRKLSVIFEDDQSVGE